MGQLLTVSFQAEAQRRSQKKAVFFFCAWPGQKNGVKMWKKGKRVSVNVVQNEKMKISTIAESEKNSEKSLHCTWGCVKILT